MHWWHLCYHWLNLNIHILVKLTSSIVDKKFWHIFSWIRKHFGVVWDFVILFPSPLWHHCWGAQCALCAIVCGPMISTQRRGCLRLDGVFSGTCALQVKCIASRCEIKRLKLLHTTATASTRLHSMQPTSRIVRWERQHIHGLLFVLTWKAWSGTAWGFRKWKLLLLLLLCVCVCVSRNESFFSA